VGYDLVVGRSPAMLEVSARLDRIIAASDPVVIQGETGTGKDLLAQLIHDRGPRRHREFVVVNCAGLPDSLLESELFGHERGAFTGADQPRTGLYEMAHRGTLFLDEIADMSPRMQGDLLRALETGELRRLGGREPFHVDVRVIAASNRDLQREVARGCFRADLFYRLNVLKLDLPPLRDRLEDVPLLVESLLRRVANGRPAPRFTERAMSRLAAYPWPGNVRQLQNVLRVLTVAGLDTIDEHDLPPELRTAAVRIGRGTLREAEEDAIRRAVAETGGNKSRAAKLLGVDRKTLYVKLRRLGLHSPP
jgi:DNA-binding NtrC family response regulator